MRYWTSDPHFFHEKIIGFCDRPFKDVSHMHEELIQRWNDVVTADDVVIMLGDITFKHPSHLEIIDRLNGKKVLVAGNHDRVFQGMRWADRKKAWPYFEKHFDLVGSLGEPIEVTFDGRPELRVRACHFPFTVGAYDERFREWHPEDDGGWILHGHVHSKERVRGRQIHVGVDAWDFTPVSDEQILEIIDAHA